MIILDLITVLFGLLLLWALCRRDQRREELLDAQVSNHLRAISNSVKRLIEQERAALDAERPEDRP